MVVLAERSGEGQSGRSTQILSHDHMTKTEMSVLTEIYALKLLFVYQEGILELKSNNEI